MVHAVYLISIVILKPDVIFNTDVIGRARASLLIDTFGFLPWPVD